MSIPLNDNIKIAAGKPSESKYLTPNVLSYTGTSHVFANVPLTERHIGLTVNINNEEFWFKTGLTNSALVIKGSALTGTTGSVAANNGLSVQGGSVVLGGTLTGNTIIDIDDKSLSIQRITEYNSTAKLSVVNEYVDPFYGSDIGYVVVEKTADDGSGNIHKHDLAIGGASAYWGIIMNSYISGDTTSSSRFNHSVQGIDLNIQNAYDSNQANYQFRSAGLNLTHNAPSYQTINIGELGISVEKGSINFPYYSTGDLPDASSHTFGFLFDTDESILKRSDGTDWLPAFAGGSASAANGLSVQSGNVVLGGELTGSTLIEGTTELTEGVQFGNLYADGGSKALSYFTVEVDEVPGGFGQHSNVSFSIQPYGISISMLYENIGGTIYPYYNIQGGVFDAILQDLGTLNQAKFSLGANGGSFYIAGQNSASENGPLIESTGLGGDINISNNGGTGIQIGSLDTGHAYPIKLSTASGTGANIELNAGDRIQLDAGTIHITPTGSFQLNLPDSYIGDMYYRDDEDNTARLPIGEIGQLLGVSDAGIPEWQTISGGTTYTFGNGLSENDSIVSIGGVLTDDIVFDGDGSADIDWINLDEFRLSAGTINISGYTTFDGIVAFDKYFVPGGTTGAQTVNKLSGSVNFAPGASTLVVTNSFADTDSNILVTVYGTDATATSARVTRSSGSFTITLNAAATAETTVGFFVFN